VTLSAGSASAQQAFCGPTPCATLGAATVNTITFSSNGESITNATDGSFIFTRDETGTVTLSCDDGEASTSCLLDSKGVGSIAIGSADTGSLLVTTDGTGTAEVQLPDDSIGADELSSSEVCGTLLYSSVNPTEAGATDDFMSFWDHSGSTTEANEDEFLVNSALLTFHSLRCDIDVAPGAGADDWRIVVKDDGVDTAVTCDISETAVFCIDATNSAAAAAASAVNFDINSDVGAGADPAAAALITCTVCMGP